MPKVLFSYAEKPLFLKNKKKLKDFIECFLFPTEQTGLQRLSYVFCSDDYLLRINQDFLQHDDYTDIITFNLSGAETDIVGEVYISIDRVKDNSVTLGVPFTEEILRVIMHGALHLCGYNDKTEIEIITMREKENTYIKEYKKRST